MSILINLIIYLLVGDEIVVLEKSENWWRGKNLRTNFLGW